MSGNSFKSLGYDYNDGYLRKRWFVAWYSSKGTRWIRVFGFGVYYSELRGFKILFPVTTGD